MLPRMKSVKVQHCVTFAVSCNPPPNPLAGGPPVVGCFKMLTLHVHSYTPYLEAVFSNRKLRMRHVLVTRDLCVTMMLIK